MKDAEEDDENEMEAEHSGRSYARGGYSRGRYPITGGYAMASGYDDRRSGYYPMEYYDPYRRY